MMEPSQVAYKPKLSSSQFKKEARLPDGRSQPTPMCRPGTKLAILGRGVISLRRQGLVSNLREINNRPRW